MPASPPAHFIRSVRIAIVALLALAAVAVSYPAVSRIVRPPLDEKGRYDLLSDGAARRWVREDLLLGKSVTELRSIFGADNVHLDDAKQGASLNYDSCTTGSIWCTLQDGSVTSAILVEP